MAGTRAAVGDPARILAAVSEPHPGISSSAGAWALTREAISRSSSLAGTVISRQRATSSEQIRTAAE